MNKETVSLKCDFEYAFRFVKTEENFNELWGMKSSTRESMKDWLIASTVKPEKADICANACSELVENCIKFSKNGSTSVISIKIKDRSIIVETFNESEKEHKNDIAGAFKELNQASDPRQLFAERLLSPPQQGKGRLGLIKIALETRGKIGLENEPENVVHVKLEMEAK
ncbi:MAG: hypothetical protein GY795_50135 [Desulfobacterales bacterium]|nr:hypothetical protein [Desulfobacterales bacterium]